jgi:molybdopterin/thiamine biosynthesis adenylyltransferase
MAVIRIPDRVWTAVRNHLFAIPGEHFAFMLARWTLSGGEPVFLVRDVVLIPDEQVHIGRNGWELTTEGILTVVNAAVRSGDALIEVHNHGGTRPRFSERTDRPGLAEFSAYILDSLPGRPYGATVWGDTTVYGEFFLQDGRTGVVRSITVNAERLHQLVSRDDDEQPLPVRFDRQLAWFTTEGQRRLGRLRVAIAGAGGTGSQLAQQLAYLGVRDFVVVDDDRADESNMNRLVTATAADIGTPKAILARRLIRSVAPDARVWVIDGKVQSREALDALKGVEILFGCFDNDGARLILNEVAVAYSIPYFDLAVGIDVEHDMVENAGGRVAVVLPGGPCLHCIGEIDREEAAFALNTPEQQAFQLERGYVRGMRVKAPAVASLNAVVAGVAVNEFAAYISEVRPVNVYTEFDLLGVGRPLKSQWLTPKRITANPGCVVCAVAGIGNATNIERYGKTADLTCIGT